MCLEVFSHSQAEEKSAALDLMTMAVMCFASFSDFGGGHTGWGRGNALLGFSDGQNHALGDPCGASKIIQVDGAVSKGGGGGRGESGDFAIHRK